MCNIEEASAVLQAMFAIAFAMFSVSIEQHDATDRA